VAGISAVFRRGGIGNLPLKKILVNYWLKRGKSYSQDDL
jgi:hypothetical protein